MQRHWSFRGTESTALHILRIIQEEAMKENSAAVHAQVPVDVATFLLNEKRADIHSIEARLKVKRGADPEHQPRNSQLQSGAPSPRRSEPGRCTACELQPRQRAGRRRSKGTRGAGSTPAAPASRSARRHARAARAGERATAQTPGAAPDRTAARHHGSYLQLVQNRESRSLDLPTCGRTAPPAARRNAAIATVVTATAATATAFAGAMTARNSVKTRARSAR